MANPGHIIRGFELEALLDQVYDLTDPGWDSWTPTWTSTGTQPALGNGTLTGGLRRPADSDMVQWWLRLSIGSTTTFGTLIYQFSYPTDPAPSATALTVMAPTGWVYDDSSTAIYPVAGRVQSANVIRVGRGDGSIFTPSVPITWATNDIFVLNGFYEPA